MKRMMALLGFALAGNIGAATPQVGNVTFAPDGVDGRMKITYTLDAPAIVSVELRANGERLPAAAAEGLAGAVNRIVPAGTHTVTWNACSGWNGNNAAVTARVTASATNSLPLYLAIDLSGGTDASTWPVMYFADEASVPGGVTNKTWKTTAMLFRRIDPTDSVGFVMGCAYEHASNRHPLREHPVRVWLTKPYYMAVFETTNAQWVRLGGADCATDRYYLGSMAPVDKMRYTYVRGSDKGLQWPEVAEPDDASAAGYFRLRTGLAVDIPTEAQWEWACQAGAGDTVANYDWVVHPDGTKMLQFSGDNRVHPQYDFDEAGPREVGSFPPNAFGLYDMEGNAWEFARDHYVEDRRTLANQIDPEGPSSTSEAKVVIRGGSYYQGFNGFNAMTGKGQESVTIASRHPYGVTQGDSSVTVRFSIDVDGSPASTSVESAPCAVDARVKTVALSEGLRIDTLHAMGSLFILR